MNFIERIMETLIVVVRMKNVKDIYLSTSVLPDKTYFICDMSLTSEIPDYRSTKLDIKMVIIIITNTS